MSSSPFMTLASMSFFFIIYLSWSSSSGGHHSILLLLYNYSVFAYVLHFWVIFLSLFTPKSCKRVSSVIDTKKSAQTIIIFTYNDFILMVWSYNALKLEVTELENSLFSWAYLPTFQYIKLGKENHKHHKTIKRKIIKDCFHVLWSMYTSIYISRFFSHET
jgi:hypothetical protein